MAQGAGEGVAIGIGEGMGDFADAIRAHRARLDKERDDQADQLDTQIRSIADNIQRVGGANTPEGQQLAVQLKDAVAKHNALFPPHQAPALLQRLEKLGGHKPGAPKPDIRAGMTPEGAIAEAKRPEYSTTDAGRKAAAQTTRDIAIGDIDTQTQIDNAKRDAAIKWGQTNGLAPDKITELTQILAGVPSSVVKPTVDPSGQWDVITGKLSNGTHVTFQRSRRDNSVVDMAGNAIPKESLVGFVEDPKGTPPRNKQAWILRDGKPLSVMLDPENHPIPGTENPDAVPPPSLFGRITTTDFIYDDGFGNMQKVPKTTTSTPIGMTAPPAAATPPGATTPFATPGQAKAAVAAAQGPTPIGAKATQSQKTAQTDVDKAVKMVSLADEAIKNPTALTDKNLAISLAREASGRFSMAEFDTMVKNAGLGNTLQQWIDNVQSGKLTDEIRNQLALVAKNNLTAAKAGLAASTHAGAPAAGNVDQQILEKLNRLPH